MSDKEATPIKLVIFDLGGTIVDHGCQAPVVAVVQAFAQLGIEVSAEQARSPMGLAKIDHIRELFKLPAIAQQWSAKHGREWSEEDVVATYERFLPLQTQIAQQHTDVIPGLDACVAAFRDHGIAIGTTTGYPRTVAGPILDALAQAGFEPDVTVCADEVAAGRPEPWMITEIMSTLGIAPPQAIVKVGDTTPDMEAARNAAVWAIGISETGSEFGLTADELAALALDDRATRHAAAEAKLREAGAHAVIKSLSELPQLIESGSFKG